jgi:phospholipase C
LGPLEIGGENVTAYRSKKLAATRDLRISPDRAAIDRHPCLEPKHRHQKTATPIKHVIVLIGENRTFDHVFATYLPQGRDSVQNLLSEGIINANGSPGWNFSKAAQFQAVPPFKT